MSSLCWLVHAFWCVFQAVCSTSSPQSCIRWAQLCRKLLEIDLCDRDVLNAASGTLLMRLCSSGLYLLNLFTYHFSRGPSPLQQLPEAGVCRSAFCSVSREKGLWILFRVLRSIWVVGAVVRSYERRGRWNRDEELEGGQGASRESDCQRYARIALHTLVRGWCVRRSRKLGDAACTKLAGQCSFRAHAITRDAA